MVIDEEACACFLEGLDTSAASYREKLKLRQIVPAGFKGVEVLFLAQHCPGCDHDALQLASILNILS
jgi:hypothetical protein